MQELIELVKAWLPNPWVQAALWLVGSWVVAWILLFLLNHLNWLGASKTKNRLDDLVIEKLKAPVKWSVIFFGIYLAAQSVAIDPFWLNAIFSLETTIAIFLWGLFAYGILRYLLKASASSANTKAFIQNRTLPLFENLLLVITLATGAYFILVAWDISVGPIIASAGILGLALSLAAKDTMANLFAGVFIMADGPYQLGDYVVLDSGERGKVTHIGIRSTRILTRDDVEITIPNAIMGNTKIINETAGPHEKYRIRIKVGLAYGSDIQKIREVLMSVTTISDEICSDPAPRVRFREFGDSALLFELLCWVPFPELRGKVSDILNEAVYNALNENNITIPFPQQDVYLHHVDVKEK